MRTLRAANGSLREHLLPGEERREHPLTCSVRKLFSRCKFTEQIFTPQTEQNFPLRAQIILLLRVAEPIHVTPTQFYSFFFWSDSFYALNVCAVCMQNIVFSCSSAYLCRCHSDSRLGFADKKCSFFTVKNFTEQKFQVHKNWEMGHFSDPADLASRLRSMRGTGFSWAAVISWRSTGQICCRDSHSVMQPRQKACSHAGACTTGGGQRGGLCVRDARRRYTRWHVRDGRWRVIGRWRMRDRVWRMGCRALYTFHSSPTATQANELQIWLPLVLYQT